MFEGGIEEEEGALGGEDVGETEEGGGGLNEVDVAVVGGGIRNGILSARESGKR